MIEPNFVSWLESHTHAHLLRQVHGKVLELASHHTASRIIQFCAKYGSEQQRSAIMAEVRASMVELSKGKHGHHLVQKLIAMSKRDEVAGGGRCCLGGGIEGKEVGRGRQRLQSRGWEGGSAFPGGN